MESKEKLKGFQGIFVNKETEKRLLELQKDGLPININNMHVTFNYGDIEVYPEELMDKEFKLKLLGYESDGKNSGFSVELPDELKKYYKNSSIPHITVSIGVVDGAKGRPVDTGKLDFKPLEEVIEIEGKLGYFIFDKGIYMDNKVINEYQHPFEQDER